MRTIALIVFTSLAAAPLLAQKDKILEISRDVALLQNEVRSMKSAMDEKFAGLNVLVQQALDNAQKTNTAVAVLDKTINDRMRDQATSISAPVAGLNAKVDGMATEFALMKESVAELNESIRKLQSQLSDINNAVRVLAAPPAPVAAPPTPTGPPAGVTSESLFNSAIQAKLAGQNEFALQQLQDFVKFFPDAPYAPNAHLNMGQVLVTMGRYDDAVLSFDAVLEKFPDFPKALDAQLEKGRALAKSGQRTAAVNEFRNLIKKNENTPQATRAKEELKSLGMPYTQQATQGRKKR
jgi:TolA-binding protein